MFQISKFRLNPSNFSGPLKSASSIYTYTIISPTPSTSELAAKRNASKIKSEDLRTFRASYLSPGFVSYWVIVLGPSKPRPLRNQIAIFWGGFLKINSKSITSPQGHLRSPEQGLLPLFFCGWWVICCFVMLLVFFGIVTFAYMHAFVCFVVCFDLFLFGLALCFGLQYLLGFSPDSTHFRH